MRKTILLILLLCEIPLGSSCAACDLKDFAILAADWGKPQGEYEGDISGVDGIPDGFVDCYDLQELVKRGGLSYKVKVNITGVENCPDCDIATLINDSWLCTCYNSGLGFRYISGKEPGDVWVQFGVSENGIGVGGYVMSGGYQWTQVFWGFVDGSFYNQQIINGGTVENYFYDKCLFGYGGTASWDSFHNPCVPP